MKYRLYVYSYEHLMFGTLWTWVAEGYGVNINKSSYKSKQLALKASRRFATKHNIILNIQT